MRTMNRTHATLDEQIRHTRNTVWDLADALELEGRGDEANELHEIGKRIQELRKPWARKS